MQIIYMVRTTMPLFLVPFIRMLDLLYFVSVFFFLLLLLLLWNYCKIWEGKSHFYPQENGHPDIILDYMVAFYLCLFFVS